MKKLYLLVCSFLFTATAIDAIAQTVPKDNFFADINSINVIIDISGDHEFCRIRESEIRSSVAYVLSNTPLRKIDSSSSDILFMSFIVMNVQNRSSTSLGCAVATNSELWRRSNFKGVSTLITVWSSQYLNAGIPGEIGTSISSLAERITKQFISRWSERR